MVGDLEVDHGLSASAIGAVVVILQGCRRSVCRHGEKGVIDPIARQRLLADLLSYLAPDLLLGGRSLQEQVCDEHERGRRTAAMSAIEREPCRLDRRLAELRPAFRFSLHEVKIVVIIETYANEVVAAQRHLAPILIAQASDRNFESQHLLGQFRRENFSEVAGPHALARGHDFSQDLRGAFKAQGRNIVGDMLGFSVVVAHDSAKALAYRLSAAGFLCKLQINLAAALDRRTFAPGVVKLHPLTPRSGLLQFALTGCCPIPTRFEDTTSVAQRC
jgi:hypothetical protein